MSFAPSHTSSTRIFGKIGSIKNIEKLEGVDLTGELQLMDKIEPMQGVALLEPVNKQKEKKVETENIISRQEIGETSNVSIRDIETEAQSKNKVSDPS